MVVSTQANQIPQLVRFLRVVEATKLHTMVYLHAMTISRSMVGIGHRTPRLLTAMLITLERQLTLPRPTSAVIVRASISISVSIRFEPSSLEFSTPRPE